MLVFLMFLNFQLLLFYCHADSNTQVISCILSHQFIQFDSNFKLMLEIHSKALEF